MYIWVILATFLAMLASYTLSIRPDMRAITVEPVAEAVVGKVMVQHKAAQNYVKYQKPPYTADKKMVEFDAGPISDGDILKEMPYGFEMPDGYYSYIYCLNTDMTANSENESPCNDNSGKRLLVTFGPIPHRWVMLNADMERPNMDLINAMRKIVNGGEKFGYIAPIANADDVDAVGNVSHSDVRLIDRDGSYGVFVPRAVVEDADFRSVCSIEENKICLVYMSNI